MNKRPNIIWIAIEGNRHFSNKDRYGRNDIFDNLPTGFSEFTQCITTATSTLMSTSSFLTGRQAYELYYAHAALKSFDYPSYLDALKSNGYHTHMTFFCGEGDRFYPLSTRKENEYKSTNEKVWSNFLEIMNNKFVSNEPNFVYIHTAPTNTQEFPNKLLDVLKQKKIYEDAIIILSSDHGYTDFGSFKPIGWLRRPRNHSLYVTEDCYRANFAMRIPNLEVPRKKIDEPVLLQDALETVFDYLNISYVPANKVSQSLLPNLRSSKPLYDPNRIMRIDCRYIGQDSKQTIIRNHSHELHVKYDQTKFYKRISAKKWKGRLLKCKPTSDPPTFKKLRDYYNSSEKIAFQTCSEYLEKEYSISELAKHINSTTSKKIGIFTKTNSFYNRNLHKLIGKTKQVSFVAGPAEVREVDEVIAIKCDPYNFGMSKIHKHAVKQGKQFLVFDQALKPVPFVKHSIVRHAKSDWRAYVGKGPVDKCVIFLVLCWLQIIDLLTFGRMRDYESKATLSFATPR